MSKQTNDDWNGLKEDLKVKLKNRSQVDQVIESCFQSIVTI